MATLTGPQTLSHVASRFGLGGRPDMPLPANTTTWLTQQLGTPMKLSGPSLDTCLNYYYTYTRAPLGSTARTQAGISIRQLLAGEQQAYMVQAVTTAMPFQERLVRFWANHFAIQAATMPTYCLAGTFVRDAIRPYVNGPFVNMLQAVMQHPAMLYSLNNTNSVGANSNVAVRKSTNGLTSSGINENLGRETLELFTVGVNSGYTQADVDALANLLTGFTVNLNTRPFGFAYNTAMAEKGNAVLLGTTYPNTQLGCLGALASLATNPFTYMNLAGKLASHFLSDEPSAAAINTIANALASSGGNLAAAANAVIGCSEAWQPLTKLRSPQDYVIAMARAASLNSGSVPAMNTLALELGEPVWQPPFPNGWPDDAQSWCGPAPIGNRAAFASSFSAAHASLNVGSVSAGTVGGLLSATTNAAIASASDNATKLTLLFSSPEFQRR